MIYSCPRHLTHWRFSFPKKLVRLELASTVRRFCRILFVVGTLLALESPFVFRKQLFSITRWGNYWSSGLASQQSKVSDSENLFPPSETFVVCPLPSLR